jgi:hypothetical protein
MDRSDVSYNIIFRAYRHVSGAEASCTRRGWIRQGVNEGLPTGSQSFAVTAFPSVCFGTRKHIVVASQGYDDSREPRFGLRPP